jgi:hypothetical protein
MISELSYLVISGGATEGFIDPVPAVDLGDGQGEVRYLGHGEEWFEAIEYGVVCVCMEGQ